VALLSIGELAQLGRAGAFFLILIYYGEVNEDSDGPIELCRPILDSRAEELALRFPRLALRVEPAREEASVRRGGGELDAARWLLVSNALTAWVSEQQRLPSEPGVRLTSLAEPPRTDGGPDIDFAVAPRSRSDPRAA
jgi:hypothetical protein